MNTISIRIFVVTALALMLGCVSTQPRDDLWVDVRSDTEYQEDHIAGTTNIPHTEIATGIAALNIDKSTPVFLFCGSGRRAGIAEETLRALGYTNITNAGGIDDAREQIAEEQ